MPCALPPQPDIIVFLLDDARFDHVDGIPDTIARLTPMAVEFERAYVNTPLCCPERAQFLAGGYYAHQVGVLTNARPNGGATRFDDTRTLPVRLQGAGYATSLLGKYLNEYEELGAYVPPGWTDWGVNSEDGGWTGFDVLSGTSGPDAPGVGTVAAFPGYITDWQTERALEFLTDHAEEPRFLYLSFRAPHHPYEPAEEDRALYPGYLYRERGYQEADVSDKPAWIQERALFTAEEQADADARNLRRLQSLRAVDRAMIAVIDAVEAAGNLDGTVFVLTSDNGVMFGEHRMDGKSVGYEESVRVPLLVANPAFAAGVSDTLVAMPLDVPATVQALAGLPMEGEGQDLAPWLCGSGGAGREHVLLEAWVGDLPAWSGLVTQDYSYLESETGERELYELGVDPYQLESRHADPDEAARIEGYAASLAAERGLSVLTAALPDATVGGAYEAELSRWGGVDPVVWSLRSGALPEGLALSEGGTISGVPVREGVATIEVLATDASRSPYDGSPQEHSRSFRLDVGPAAPEDGAAACGCSGRAGGLVGLLWWARRRRSAPR